MGQRLTANVVPSFFYTSMLKRIFRALCVGLFLVFAWPFFLYKRYGNLTYTPSGNTIIVSNHYSTFDAFFIYLMYGKRKRIRFVTIAEVKTKCLSRFVTWLFDCLYLDYSKTNYTFFKQCLEILRQDGVICIYPEGEINPLKFGFSEFKSSFILLARKTKASILPIFIYPEYTPFRRTKLYIGDVISAENYGMYADDIEAAIFVQSKIMDYSLLVGTTKPPLQIPGLPTITQNDQNQPADKRK